MLKNINEWMPRVDYRELLQLKIMLLGGSPPAGVKFNKLGAYQRAHCMAKLIFNQNFHVYETI